LSCSIYVASEVGPPVAQIDMKKIRPSYSEKFRPGIIQAILTEEIQELLLGKVYEEDKAQGWITELCTKINGKVKELGFPRYKHITNVTIGERRGQGIILGTKCVWDVDSDYSAYYSYSNVSFVKLSGSESELKYYSHGNSIFGF